MPEDLYNVLGVSRTATQDEIKKAYRKLAHQHHPDKKTGNEETFKRINAAYEVLGDEEKRTHYDRFGNADFSQGGFSGDPFAGFAGAQFDMSDIFEQFFGGASRRQSRVGEDIAVDLEIAFGESVTGVKKDIEFRSYDTCSHCHGNGAEPGTPIATCVTCQGSGVIRTNRQTMFGTFSQQQTCPTCAGEGKTAKTPCKTCRGEGRQVKNRSLTIDIPAGIDDGQTIRIAGKGEVPAHGGQPGTLYATIHVARHKELTRDGLHIRTSRHISFLDAILGQEITVPTVAGEEPLTIPAGTQPGTEFRLRRQGFPPIGGGTRGDEIVTINVSIPQKLSRHERQVLEELQSGKKKKSFF